MRLGLNIGYWGLGLQAEDQLQLVQEADRLGYDSVWAAEAYGSDAATVLAWLAARTTRIGLGSAVFQLPGRSPALAAMTAATLDQLSGGRFRLGLGLSGPQVAEGWHGQSYDRPLARMRDYVAVVRLALGRQRVQHQGETFQVPLPGGPGKALKLTIAPVTENLPVYVAAIGPQATALAGEVADGWLPIFLSPEHMAIFHANLEAGAARARRSLDGFDIAPTVSLSVNDDIEAARDALRPLVALYVGGMGSKERNFYADLVARYGFEEAARTVQELYLQGRKREAEAALPGQLIDAISLCGPPARVRDRLALYREAGVGTVIVAPAPGPLERMQADLRLLCELVS